MNKDASADASKVKAFQEAIAELAEAEAPYEADRARLLSDPEAFAAAHAETPPEENEAQHAARKAFDPFAESLRGLVKQVDLLYKLTARVADLAADLLPPPRAGAAQIPPSPLAGEGRGGGLEPSRR